jgi:uncharacterized membrane protein
MSAKSKKVNMLNNYGGLINALLISNGISLLLFILRVLDSGSMRYWFLVWNSVLAWLPMLFAMSLVLRLKKYRWQDPTNIVLGIMWLLFLPNSFYLVSDLIHLQATAEVSVLYDAVMFTSFIINGFISGYISIYFIHHELNKPPTSLRSGYYLIQNN